MSDSKIRPRSGFLKRDLENLLDEYLKDTDNERIISTIKELALNELGVLIINNYSINFETTCDVLDLFIYLSNELSYVSNKFHNTIRTKIDEIYCIVNRNSKINENAKYLKIFCSDELNKYKFPNLEELVHYYGTINPPNPENVPNLKRLFFYCGPDIQTQDCYILPVYPGLEKLSIYSDTSLIKLPDPSDVPRLKYLSCCFTTITNDPIREYFLYLNREYTRTKIPRYPLLEKIYSVYDGPPHILPETEYALNLIYTDWLDESNSHFFRHTKRPMYIKIDRDRVLLLNILITRAIRESYIIKELIR
jgi:hypothetical protein